MGLFLIFKVSGKRGSAVAFNVQETGILNVSLCHAVLRTEELFSSDARVIVSYAEIFVNGQ